MEVETIPAGIVSVPLVPVKSDPAVAVPFEVPKSTETGMSLVAERVTANERSGESPVPPSVTAASAIVRSGGSVLKLVEEGAQALPPSLLLVA